MSKIGRPPQHGMSGTKVHRTWKAIKQRCHNKKSKDFKRYGGRGITVCKRWIESFNNFYLDMGDPPSPTHSIDRINNANGYNPRNCRWATPEVQYSNKSYFRWIEHNGVTKTESDWCRSLGMKPGHIHMRIKHGFSIKEAIERPVIRRRRLKI